MENRISRINDLDFSTDELFVGVQKTCDHITLVWLTEENMLKIAHKINNTIEILSRDLNSFCADQRKATQVYIADTSIESDDAEHLINYLEAKFRTKRVSCPYGYNSEGFLFSSTGLIRVNENGSGLTCGSFIVKLLKDQLNITLFEENFGIRDADILKQKVLTNRLLESDISGLINADNLRNDTGKFPQFTPIFVMAALLSPATSYPLSREDMDSVCEKIVSFFDREH